LSDGALSTRCLLADELSVRGETSRCAERATRKALPGEARSRVRARGVNAARFSETDQGLPTGLRSDEEFERQRFEALLGLALAAERDEGASEHAERVARTAFGLAQQLGFSRREAAFIYQAAPLHDLGKIVVSAELLMKPGKLSADEFEQVKIHTTAGAGLLAFGDSPLLRLASEIALAHHERWDGSGYPAGLCGEDIPLSGRIVALADVFDALTHERPYKRAWPLEEAIAELCRLRGTHFDPHVVDAFLRPVRSGAASVSTLLPGSIAATR